jgi:multidrug/hemolysin transport system permease protein
MINFGIRNLKIFFKDRAAVFFSLMAVFIIIGLYALFLGDVWMENYSDVPGIRFIMDSWIMSGLLAVTSFTTTLGAFGIMVHDKERKISKDFAASPVKASSITGGYIFSAVIIGILMSLLTLVLAEIYIVSTGGELLALTALIKVLGLIVLCTLCNTALILFLISFFRSSNAFTTASAVLGTLIGFITGIYLPIGTLSSGVQWIIKCFPISHGAALFRQVMMETPMAASFKGAPLQAVSDFENRMGVTYKFGDTACTPLMSIAILLATIVVFYVLSLINLSRKQK